MLGGRCLHPRKRQQQRGPDLQLSQHYSLADFAQPRERDHDAVAYPPMFIERARKLATVLEIVAHRLGVEIHVISGFRSMGGNVRVHGLRSSSHTEGWAADVYSRERSARDIYDELARMAGSGTHLGELSLHTSYCHLSVGPAQGAARPSWMDSRETLCLTCGRTTSECRDLGCRYGDNGRQR